MEINHLVYNEQLIRFFIENESEIMVSATDMGKIFGAEPYDFYRTKNMKTFISAYCKSENLDFCNEFTKNGVLVKAIRGGRYNGTWMNKIVALKFAGWLDISFEIWAYHRIYNHGINNFMLKYGELAVFENKK